MLQHLEGNGFIGSRDEEEGRSWYPGMGYGTLVELKAMNKNSEPSEEQQRHNVNVAYESYARARRIRDKAKRYEGILEGTDDRPFNAHHKNRREN